MKYQLIQLMQPYRNTQQEKGLFTFYRQQAQIQQNASKKRKSTGIQIKSGQILSQININEDNNSSIAKGGNDNQKNYRHMNLSQHLKEGKKNENYKQFRKQQIILDELIEIQQQYEQVKHNQQANNHVVVLEESKHTKAIHSKLNPANDFSHQDHFGSVFKKYNSQVDQLNYKKLKKMCHKQFPQKYSIINNKINNNVKLDIDIDQPNSVLETSPKALHNEHHLDLFKKLAIQPKSFQAQNINISVNSSMTHRLKKLKIGLKSYRRQKYQIPHQNNDQKDNQSIIRLNFTTQKIADKYKQKSPFIMGQELRHIRTQKHSIKHYIKQLDKQTQKSKQTSFPSIQKGRKPQTDQGYSMQFQLQRSSQLKQKHSIKNMQQQEYQLRQIKDHMKRGSLDMDQMNHRVQVQKLPDAKLFPQRIENQQRIFTNRRNQQKNIIKNIRMHIFEQSNLRQKKLQREMLVKKKQLLHNLLQNFNFL